MESSYNSVHFDHSKNEEAYKNLDKHEMRIEILLDYTIEFLQEADWSNQKAHCDIYLKLLRKVRFNLESISQLLPLLKQDYRFKVSVNILFRGIIDDLININYLIIFFDPSDENQTALEYEFLILHKEYLAAVKEIHKAELQIRKALGDEINIENEIDTLENRIKTENPQLYIGDIPKKNYEIRSSKTIRNDLIEIYKSTGSSKFISEFKKINSIALFRESTSELLTLFKYFSQFHHFTPHSDILILDDIQYDLQCYLLVQSELLYGLSVLSNIIEFKDRERSLKSFKGYENLVLGTVKDNGT